MRNFIAKRTKMEVKIFIVLGFINFIDALFQKWNLWDYISKVGSNSSSVVFYKLTNCKFCLMFHFSVLTTIFVGVISGFEWGLFCVPFVSVGLTTLISRK